MTHTSSNPSECVLVPREPTQAMWAAFRNADEPGNISFHTAYRAMIAATPTPAIAGEGLQPSVKLLEWEQTTFYDKYCLKAQTVVGDYWFVTDGGRYTLVGPDGQIGHSREFMRPSDGIPKAQAHFEARFLSCLASPSPAVPSSYDREKPHPIECYWYLGAMNDGLFIIDKPPHLPTDPGPVDCPNGPEMVLNVVNLTQDQAKAIVDAHNASIRAALALEVGR